jgi:hypothetical protein
MHDRNAYRIDSLEDGGNRFQTIFPFRRLTFPFPFPETNASLKVSIFPETIHNQVTNLMFCV